MLFLWRLLLAPFVGLLITLVTIPLIAIAGGGIGVFVAIGGAPGLGIIAIAVVAMLILMNAIMTQLPRYAGSFSGAMRLSEQIPFFKAFWRVLIILIVLTIITSVLMFAFVLAFAKQGTDVLSFLQSLDIDGDEAGAERAFIGFLESKWFLAYTLMLMFSSAIQAVFLVPAACGMGERFALAWTGKYFLLRLILVIPFLTIVVHAIGSALGVVLVDLVPSDSDFKFSSADIRWTLISLFSMQFALAGEAAVLRSARGPESGPADAAQVREQQVRGPTAGDLLRDRMAR